MHIYKKPPKTLHILHFGPHPSAPHQPIIHAGSILACDSHRSVVEFFYLAEGGNMKELIMVNVERRSSKFDLVSCIIHCLRTPEA